MASATSGARLDPDNVPGAPTVPVTEHTRGIMRTPKSCRHQLVVAVVALIVIASPAVSSPPPQGTGQRPMTFLDMQEFASPGSWTPSPDGEWMLYTVRTPNWQEAESQSDIHLVSMTDGLPSHRQRRARYVVCGGSYLQQAKRAPDVADAIRWPPDKRAPR